MQRILLKSVLTYWFVLLISCTLIWGCGSNGNTGGTVNNDDDGSVNNDDDGSVINPGFTIGSISGNISETGGSANFTVKLKSQPTNDVYITVSSDNTNEGIVSVEDLTFTPDNWNADQSVAVYGVDDDVQDGNQTLSIILGEASSADSSYNGLNPDDVVVTNIDDETAGFTIGQINGVTTEENAGTATFTIKLNCQPADNVIVNLSSTDTSEGTVNPDSLTFTLLNWNSEQTVTVRGVDDELKDGNQTYDIMIEAAISNDSNYSGLNPPDVSVTNIDNDTPGFIISSISGDVTEGGDTANFSVRLTCQPAAAVTIPIFSDNTGEGTVDPASLIFTDSVWNVEQAVTITGVNDDVKDGDQAFTIVLGTASSGDDGYHNLNPDDVSALNIDDDTAGFTIGAVSGNTTEAGGGATFTVKLKSQPNAVVTIPVSTSDTSEGTVDISSLVFTASNWNDNQTVSLTGVDDDRADGNRAYYIYLGLIVSSDTAYSGMNPDNVRVINEDNDVSPSVSSTSPADASINESPTQRISITFNKPMDVSTITGDSLLSSCVESDNIQVSSNNFISCVEMTGSPIVSNGNRTFTFTPTSKLDFNKTYQIKVKNAVRDFAGNRMRSEFQTAVGFTTGFVNFIDGNQSSRGIEKNGISAHPKLASHGSNLYATWAEGNASSIRQIRVAKWDGFDTWTFIDGDDANNGINKNPSFSAYFPNIISFQSDLYAMWAEYNSSWEHQVRVAKWDGISAWNFVDGDLDSTGINNNINANFVEDLSFDNSSDISLRTVWVEENPSSIFQFRTSAWNGSSFPKGSGTIDAGHNRSSAQNAQSPNSFWPGYPISNRIAIWSETNSSFNGQIRLTKGGGFYDGGDPEVGVNKDTTKNAIQPHGLYFNESVYVVWAEDNDSNVSQIRVIEWDGSFNWKFIDGNDDEIGINRVSSYNAHTPKLVVLRSKQSPYFNKLYAVWLEENSSSIEQIRLAEWDGESSWVFKDGNDAEIGFNKDPSYSALFLSVSVFDNRLFCTWEENDSIRVAEIDIQ